MHSKELGELQAESRRLIMDATVETAERVAAQAKEIQQLRAELDQLRNSWPLQWLFWLGGDTLCQNSGPTKGGT